MELLILPSGFIKVTKKNPDSQYFVNFAAIVPYETQANSNISIYFICVLP